MEARIIQAIGHGSVRGKRHAGISSITATSLVAGAVGLPSDRPHVSCSQSTNGERRALAAHYTLWIIRAGLEMWIKRPSLDHTQQGRLIDWAVHGRRQALAER